MASFAARSLLRSGGSSIRGVAGKFCSMKPRSSPSPFGISTGSSPAGRIFRSPVEMNYACVVSMLPYHSATASAILTSMLSDSPSRHPWTLEDRNKDV